MLVEQSLCAGLHEIVWSGARFAYPYDWPPDTENGIYIMFETGEAGHGGDRIVRVGTHTGERQLESRLRQHFSLENKDRSIFRKNIGRCFLRRAGDPYLPLWDRDRTARSKAPCAAEFDPQKERALEEEISRYLQSHISFALFRVEGKEERLRLESRIISTVSRCQDCAPSPAWLGMCSPKEKIRRSGLWQVNELDKTPLSPRTWRCCAPAL